MDMSGMDMASAIAPDFRAWAPADFAFIFVMWAVMMVAMMTPSVTPMVLLYALVGRKARMEGKPFAPTGWFFAGYVFVWVGFSTWRRYSMAAGQHGVAYPYYGYRQFNGRWSRSYRRRPLSVDTAQRCLPPAMPSTNCISDKPWRVSIRPSWCVAARFRARNILSGLLLGIDGPSLRGWRNEYRLDRRHCNSHPPGEDASCRAVDLTHLRHADCGRWVLAGLCGLLVEGYSDLGVVEYALQP